MSRFADMLGRPGRHHRGAARGGRYVATSYTAKLLANPALAAKKSSARKPSRR